MRNLIAILILAITASPLMSQDFNGDMTLNTISMNHRGRAGLIQEFDGRTPENFKGLSIDLNAAAAGAKSYLDLSVNGLGSGEGGSYLNMTVKSLDIKASQNMLFHRQPWIRTGMLRVDGYWFPDTNEVPTDDTWNNRIATYNATTAELDNEMFKRTESDLRVSYTDPKTGDYSLRAGLWEEKEQGDEVRKSSGKVMQTFVDRSLKLFSMGGDARIGSGAVAYDYTVGNFNDNAARVVISTTSSFYWQRARAPKHDMSMRSLYFRSQPVTGYNVTGSLASRTREGVNNGYKMDAYTATLAASHRFGNKLNITVKGYGRTETMEESENYNFLYSRTNNALVYRHGEDSQIDRANFTGEMLANYSLSDKMSFNLGYKLDNNFRRHPGTEMFTSSNTYEDGGFVQKNTQFNRIAKMDTRNIFTAGANIALPLDIELGLGVKALRANQAAFESMMTTSDEYSADVYMPVPALKGLSFLGSAMAMNGKNEKSHHTNSTDHQNNYLAGLEWDNGGKYSAGANYAFDQISNHSDVYYAGYAGWAQIYDVPGSRPERTLGALYRSANDVLGFHGSAKLSNEYTLSANSSYTRSIGKAPVRIVCTDGIISDTEPSDIRIVSAGMNIKYSPADNKNLSASLSLRRDQWNDHRNPDNNGRNDIGSLALSTKF